jgi:hypothetical protein
LKGPPVGLILLLLLFGAVVLRAGAVLGLDSDHVLHLAYGRAILAHGPWLSEDPTIYTAPGVPPVLHEWGAEALFAGLTASLGAWGPVRLAALIGALVPWLVYRQALRVTASFWPAIAAWVAAALGVATGLLVRPHLFSVAAFFATVQLLEAWRLGGEPRRLFPWLGLVIVLWTNLHGGGAVWWAAVLLGCYAATNRGRPGARLLPLFYLLTLVNPWTIGLHRHVARFLISAAPRVAADMGPPDLRSGTLLVLGAMTLALLLAARRRFRPAGGTSLVVTAIAFVAACLSMRNLPFLGLALGQLLPPIVSSWLAEHPDAYRRSRALVAEPALPLAGWALAALSVLPVGWLLGQPEPSGPRVPVAAIQWLRAHPEVARRRGYADYGEAGFLLNAGVVDRVYLHALNANTPLALADDHLVFRRGDPAWQDLFARHQVTWALTRADQPLSARLAGAGWPVVWREANRALHVRP